MVSGFAAAITFLGFTGVGYVAQVVRLVQRRRAKLEGKLGDQAVSEGLQPVREMWSFAAFLFFALSGVTRSYVDLFLLVSRFPVVVISAVILWFLAQDGAPKARVFFLLAVVGTVFLCALSLFVALGYSTHPALLVSIVDGFLSVISVFLFYAKSAQAWRMYRDCKARGVSWLREIGVLLKDLFGLWYTTSVGYELRWVTFTHVLSALAGMLICASKFTVERRLRNAEAIKE